MIGIISLPVSYPALWRRPGGDVKRQLLCDAMIGQARIEHWLQCGIQSLGLATRYSLLLAQATRCFDQATTLSNDVMTYLFQQSSRKAC
jgi:hypothetical protein